MAKRGKRLTLVLPGLDGDDDITFTVRKASFDAILTLTGLASDEITPVQAAEISVEVFMSAKPTWDLEEDDGTAIPLTLDSMRQELGLDDAMSVVRTWRTRSTRVSRPLPSDSDSGESSAAESTGTESQLASLSSINAPSTN